MNKGEILEVLAELRNLVDDLHVVQLHLFRESDSIERMRDDMKQRIRQFEINLAKLEEKGQ